MNPRSPWVLASAAILEALVGLCLAWAFVAAFENRFKGAVMLVVTLLSIGVALYSMAWFIVRSIERAKAHQSRPGQPPDLK